MSKFKAHLLSFLIAATAAAATPTGGTHPQWETAPFQSLPSLFVRHPWIYVVVHGETFAGSGGETLREYGFCPGPAWAGGSGVHGAERPPFEQIRGNLERAFITAGLKITSPRAGHAASVDCRWGYMRHLDFGLGLPAEQNLDQRARIVGGPEFASSLAYALKQSPQLPPPLQGDHARWLANQAQHDLWYLLLTAYRVDPKGRPVVLWQTALSTDFVPTQAADAFPILIAASSPFLARKTASPVRLARQISN